MLAHLWAKAPAPWEYSELILCRDVYHCTPNDLGDVPMDKIAAHMVCLAAESRVMEAKNKHGKK